MLILKMLGAVLSLRFWVSLIGFIFNPFILLCLIALVMYFKFTEKGKNKIASWKFKKDIQKLDKEEVLGFTNTIVALVKKYYQSLYRHFLNRGMTDDKARRTAKIVMTVIIIII